ncbi:M23 family metallopeptidase [Georgenia sp. AZ-5]|uniref:M23 family metallopeptidase n=1 Tax=Georgenia sp. AZ-5 TaxID=3367526 RepID=UPI003754AF6B
MLRLLAVGLLAMLASPALVLVLLAATVASTLSSCQASATLAVGQVPDSLTATATDGSDVRLNRTQLTHAATIITVGSRTDGVGRDGLLVALMAALTESRLLMYANTGAYPASATYPHDADGADHDSLGLFQMRPAAGWGSVADLMDPTYQARAFFGGPTGPNGGSPRGLLDIPDWDQLPKGAAAQAVEVSAYPDRYARYEPVAEAILAALTAPPAVIGESGPDRAGGVSAAALPATTATVFPLPAGTWTHTSPFGMRLHPILGVRRLHAGVDLAAPAGTPVLATAAGRVVAAGYSGDLGNRLVLVHDVDGELVASVYGHLGDGGIRVAVGDLVAAGAHIGDVGSTGMSTGPHLHFQIHRGGPDASPVDPAGWLSSATEADANGAPPAPRPDFCLAVGA